MIDAITLAASIAGIVAAVLAACYTGLKIIEWIKEYRALRLEFHHAVRTDLDKLDLAFRVVNGRASTSIKEAYHEWGKGSRSDYRHFKSLGHQELVLRELDTLTFQRIQFIHAQKELETAGELVSLPLQVDSGQAKNFHTFLDRTEPNETHHFVVSMTRRKFVKRLNAALFQEDFVRSIRLMGD